MNLDGSYFRNEAIIEVQHNCSGYRSMRKYSSCTEDQIKMVKEPTKKEIAAEMEKRKVAEASKKKADAEAKVAAEAKATADKATAETYMYTPGV
jgi:hypothetical protein